MPRRKVAARQMGKRKSMFILFPTQAYLLNKSVLADKFNLSCIFVTSSQNCFSCSFHCKLKVKLLESRSPKNIFLSD
jgi:hypothetical protein